VGGWMEGKAGLRIAYSNQKLIFKTSNIFHFFKAFDYLNFKSIVSCIGHINFEPF
jgi:hypothetical protein